MIQRKRQEMPEVLQLSKPFQKYVRQTCHIYVVPGMLIKYIVWRINSGVNNVTDEVSRDGILVVLQTISYTSKPISDFGRINFIELALKLTNSSAKSSADQELFSHPQAYIPMAHSSSTKIMSEYTQM